MKIIISSIEYDPIGYIVIDAKADQTFGEMKRRMHRIATLDGGAVVNDYGYSDADRTITLNWTIKTASQEALIVRMVQTYSQCNLSASDGFYRVAIDKYKQGAIESELTLQIIEKLT